MERNNESLINEINSNFSDDINFSENSIDNEWPLNSTESIQKKLFIDKILDKEYLGNFHYNFSDNSDIDEQTFFDANQTDSTLYKSYNLYFYRSNETEKDKIFLDLNFNYIYGINGTYKYKYIIEFNISELTFKIDEKNQLFFVSNISSSGLEKQIINEECNPMIVITFPLENEDYEIRNNNKTKYLKISTIDPRYLTLFISSDCGYEITIDAQIVSFIELQEKHHMCFHPRIYSLDLINIIVDLPIISLLLINTIEIRVLKKELNIYSFSDKFIYCFIFNHFINYYYFFEIRYFTIFVYIIDFIHLLNVLFFANTFWRIKNASFYSIYARDLTINTLCISLTLGMLIYNLKILFTIISISLWTIQIIHNIIYYNRYIYPLFYIIINSIDKIFFNIYLYGFEK